jgi:hypothetical protein
MKHRIGNYFSGFIRDFQDYPEKHDALSRALRIDAIFQEIPEWTDERIVPDDSLLREFIGDRKCSQ